MTPRDVQWLGWILWVFAIAIWAFHGVAIFGWVSIVAAVFMWWGSDVVAFVARRRAARR
jgi:hypothetical protein